MVIGHDGAEYGPASLQDLKNWAAENRVNPSTQLKDFQTGQLLLASQVPGLFAAVPPPMAPGTYPPQNPYAQPPMAQYPRPAGQFKIQDDGWGPMAGVLIRCGAAILFFFVLHGIGLVFGAYALVNAIQLKNQGYSKGPIAIVIAAITLGIVLAGWGMRMMGGGV